MDTARGFGEEQMGEERTGDLIGSDGAATESAVADAMFDLGGDERRMHVRAYNHWVSLLKSRPYPSIADLDPAGIADFGPHSVLLDFTGGIDNPAIPFLGRALREECGLDASIARIADVPARSLLSRLTDHYLQIIANRAPIGFEAEFVGIRGLTTMYRGILMPFSSDGDAIDFIYGVINWKEVVDAATQATLDAELDAAVRSAPRAPAAAPVWADGPSAGLDPAETVTVPSGTLGDQLMLARESAAAVRAADTRSRSALYRALGRAHDFAIASRGDAAGYAALLADTGMTVQARAPMTPIVKLVFGGDYDKTRLTEYAAVLQHAGRHGVEMGGLASFFDGFEGGVKGVVAAERLARKPADVTPKQMSFADRATIATLSLETGEAAGSIVVLVARVAASGGLDIVGAVAGDRALSDRAVKAIG